MPRCRLLERVKDHEESPSVSKLISGEKLTVEEVDV